jgi:hypothetical protein
MTTLEQQHLHETLKEIVDRTREGEITWVRSNPTTFVWLKRLSPREGAKTTIQKVVKRERMPIRTGSAVRSVENYIFQVVEVRSGAQMVTLSTDENQEFTEILSELFEVASTNISKKGLNFLRRAIDEPPME